MFLRRAFADRGGRGAMAVDRAPVERAPLAVRPLDPVEDRVVDVRLRVVIARVVLEERRDDPVVRVGVAARGAAVMTDS
jgi:hypothetical protein